jgi:acyl-CoA synthetase (AMP-forming)/AMP-acid ligase II
MLKKIKLLYAAKLIDFKGLRLIIAANIKHGVNLLAIIAYSAKRYPNRIALNDGNQTLTYSELYTESLQLSASFSQKYHITKNSKVAMICKNHKDSIKSMIALSRVGCKTTLINTELSDTQFEEIFQKQKFDLILCEEGLINRISTISKTEYKLVSVQNVEVTQQSKNKLKRQKSGPFTILTGGSSGKIKFANRESKASNFSNPFFALLDQLKLNNHQSFYIPVPIFHGYGLAAITICLLLSKEIHLSSKFHTEEAIKTISKNDIEVLVLVPTMIERILSCDNESIKNLKVILSGGAPLNPQLVSKTQARFGDVLFNLFGTTESGFVILASPQDLKRYPNTIGKEIKGVAIQLLDNDSNEVDVGKSGELSLKTPWSMNNKKSNFIAIGDCGYRNSEGFLFLDGRKDDMVTSGGENVYPNVVEFKFKDHQQIKDASVIAIDDTEFGHVLSAFIELKENEFKPTKDDLKMWIKTKVSKFEVPKRIEIVDAIPYTPTGKIDRKKLKDLLI